MNIFILNYSFMCKNYYYNKDAIYGIAIHIVDNNCERRIEHTVVQFNKVVHKRVYVSNHKGKFDKIIIWLLSIVE